MDNFGGSGISPSEGLWGDSASLGMAARLQASPLSGLLDDSDSMLQPISFSLWLSLPSRQLKGPELADLMGKNRGCSGSTECLWPSWRFALSEGQGKVLSEAASGCLHLTT
jgi:hypothetical protein